jgi:chorismate mutase
MTDTLTHNELSSAEAAGAEALDVYRQAVERLALLDEGIAGLVVRRRSAARVIGQAKRILGLPVFNGAREYEVMATFSHAAEEAGVGREVAQDTIRALVLDARGLQSDHESASTPELSKEAPEEIIASTREQINEIDLALAAMLGERLATAEVMREARLVSGGAAANLGRERSEVAEFVELAQAGGIGDALARRIITPYVATTLA